MCIFRSAICLLLFVTFSAHAVAQNAETLNSPLTFGRVEVIDGQIVLMQFQEIEQTYQVQRPVTREILDPDGKTVTVTEMVVEERIKLVLAPTQLPTKDQPISFSTVSGGRITDLEEVRKMLEKESQPAIIVWDANPVDAYYEKVLNPKLLVVHYGHNANSVDAFLQRGDIFYGNKEYAKAIAEYNQATKIDPHHPQPWNHLAWRLATCPDETIRDGKAAVTASQKANQLIQDNSNEDGSAAFIRRTLAVAYATAGDFEQATTTVDEAIQLLGPERKPQEEDFRRNQAMFESKQILIDDPSRMARIVIDSTGTNVFQATFVSLKNDTLTLKKLDGKTVELSLSKLSEGDRQWAFESDIVPVLVGGYEAENASNDWHYVEISEDHYGRLTWKNAADRSWSLVFKDNELWTGRDCPYGEKKIEIKRNDLGEVTSVEYGSGGYIRKPSAAKIVREKTSK